MKSKLPKVYPAEGVILFLLALAPFLYPAGPGEPNDPGPRAGVAGAGGPVAGLTAKEAVFFAAGQEAFEEINDVKGGITGEAGLGPTFNLDSCGGCHAHPAVGGTSPAQNPQLLRKNVAGASNPTAFLDNVITPNGPVRELRLLSQGGGVTGLFSIKGRSDAAGCNLSAPDLRNIPANDRRFRIPTPVFGLGLIEAIPDSTIAAGESPNKPFGISGRANRSGNDGTITRFGWKAQNKSLLIFSGEAYNVEQGVSNELFPDERRPAGSVPGCVFTTSPEDHTNFDETDPTQVSSDAVGFANFMRLLAPPVPVTASFTTTQGRTVSAASIANGRAAFTKAGCNLCHTPAMSTGQHTITALANKTANLYSDLLLHNIGTGDGISQGSAAGGEFRTAPLWGVGQRLFFLHDGRSHDLVDAIGEHDGEAAGVMQKYRFVLNAIERQDLVNFLRSL